MNHRISIITATYNSASTVRDCLESIAQQRCPVEHIIVDGGSADGTLGIISSYNHVGRVISESDDGIYDAMNKGISVASGEIIGILNSDDIYADQRVTEIVQAVLTESNLDSCYGDLVYINPRAPYHVRRVWKAGVFNRRKFFWGWMPPHPSFFVRRSVYEKHGLFNLSFGSAADYELMLRFLLKHGITTKYIPEVLVKMRTGGVSNASLINRFKANRMDRKAWKANGIKPFPWTLILKPLRKVGQFLFLDRSAGTVNQQN